MCKSWPAPHAGLVPRLLLERSFQSELQCRARDVSQQHPAHAPQTVHSLMRLFTQFLMEHTAMHARQTQKAQLGTYSSNQLPTSSSVFSCCTQPQFFALRATWTACCTLMYSRLLAWRLTASLSIVSAGVHHAISPVAAAVTPCYSNTCIIFACMHAALTQCQAAKHDWLFAPVCT